MCGRFTLVKTTVLEELFQLAGLFDADLSALQPRYNISPSQTVAAVRQSSGGGRELALLRWGLVPSWSDDPKIGYKLINARAETIAQKPSFRTAFQKRRCLIPADGFFEWAKVGKQKLPSYYQHADGKLFMFAGLWERWQRDDQAIESCTILTTESNTLVRPLHDRMPVVLAPRDFAAWLDTPPVGAASLLPLLEPSPAEDWTVSLVSTRVNSPKVDDAACLASRETTDKAL